MVADLLRIAMWALRLALYLRKSLVAREVSPQRFDFCGGLIAEAAGPPLYVFLHGVSYIYAGKYGNQYRRRSHLVLVLWHTL